MISPVHSWKQAGQVFVWRYPPHKKKHRGWHFTCDNLACGSLTTLIQAMVVEAQPGSRSIALSRPSRDVWEVPNFGEPMQEAHRSIVLDYEPSFADIVLAEEGDRLRLQFGAATANSLIEALEDLRSGGGDYSLPSGSKDAAPIWLWWMLNPLL